MVAGQRADLLVRNAKLVATCDAAGRELAGGWVAVTGGVISGAGASGDPEPEAGEVLDAGGCLVDVMVAPALASRALRGACSLAWAGQRCAVAWGFVAARPGFSVWFTRGRACSAAQVTVIAGSFWIAPAGGRFREVTVEHGGGRDRCRVRAARPC